MSRLPIRYQDSDDYFNTSDGFKLHYRHWTCQHHTPRGTVLLLSGRAEFMDKYQETAAELDSRGFDTIGFDWRGQGKSDRVLSDPHRGYIRRFEDYLSDLSQFLGSVVRSLVQGPLVILAHSMGAHLALRYLSQNPKTPVAMAILNAPMLAIYTDPLPTLLARLLSRIMVGLGLGAWKVPVNRHNPFLNPWECNRLTSDPIRFQSIMSKVATEPQLNAGGLTYGWLAAAFRSMDRLNNLSIKYAPDLPVLITMAGKDRVVKNQATVRMGSQLPDCIQVMIDDARHEVLQERDELRMQFWRAFDAFTAQVST